MLVARQQVLVQPHAGGHPHALAHFHGPQLPGACLVRLLLCRWHPPGERLDYRLNGRTGRGGTMAISPSSRWLLAAYGAGFVLLILLVLLAVLLWRGRDHS
jgi:hypothetical protein